MTDQPAFSALYTNDVYMEACAENQHDNLRSLICEIDAYDVPGNSEFLGDVTNDRRVLNDFRTLTKRSTLNILSVGKLIISM